MRQPWDEFFIDVARLMATRSKDRSTKVGAVLVRDKKLIASGYNGMPRGVDDEVDSRHERPEKYSWFEHAERNAIYNAASDGIATKGSTLYVTLFPCVDCARAVIQSGVDRVVVAKHTTFTEKDAAKRWQESMSKSRSMMVEAGVKVSTW